MEALVTPGDERVTLDQRIQQYIDSIEARHLVIQQKFPRTNRTPVSSVQHPTTPTTTTANPPQTEHQRAALTASPPSWLSVHVPANNTTVILPATRSDVAKRVLIKGLERDIFPFLQKPSVVARAYTPMVPTTLTWGDIRRGDTPHSQLTLNDLLLCGVGLIDLLKAHLVTCYDDLKRYFQFNPADFMTDYPLFNMGHMKQFFNVDYTHLAVDFRVGLDDYLNTLRLSLQDINSAGIDIQTALEWPTHVKKAFETFNRGDPTEKNKMDSRISSLMRPLDAAMFITRVKHSNDSPENWVAFFGMSASHLAQIGISLANLMDLWGAQYGSIQQILKIFSCTSADYQQLLANGNNAKTTTTTTSSASILPLARSNQSYHHSSAATSSHSSSQHQQRIVLPPLAQMPPGKPISLDSIWYPGRDKETKASSRKGDF